MQTERGPGWDVRSVSGGSSNRVCGWRWALGATAVVINTSTDSWCSLLSGFPRKEMSEHRCGGQVAKF